jgi:hypothetical protein
MTGHQAGLFSYSLVACFLIWVAVFAGWRSYRVSALQENLEALSDRLADMVASGVLAASLAEVEQLRRLLQAAVRQSGMMTLTRLLLADSALRLGILTASRAVATWGSRAELREIREQMRSAIARHVIAGCPIAWIFLPRAIPMGALDELLERG